MGVVMSLESIIPNLWNNLIIYFPFPDISPQVPSILPNLGNNASVPDPSKKLTANSFSNLEHRVYC